MSTPFQSSHQPLRQLLFSLKTTYTTTQTRYASLYPNFTPRHKYAKPSKLDKLHRQQKAAHRQERIDSLARASTLSEVLEATTPPQANELPYFVNRTKTRNLPVYESVKGGGSSHVTKVQKCSGDLAAMQVALRTVLGLPESYLDRKGRRRDPVLINHLTKHIVVKGWRAPEIKKWAEAVGF